MPVYIYIYFNRRMPQRKTNAAHVCKGYCKAVSVSRMDTANVSGRQSADETAECAIRYTLVDIFFFITTGNQTDNMLDIDTDGLSKKKGMNGMQNQGAQIRLYLQTYIHTLIYNTYMYTHIYVFLNILQIYLLFSLLKIVSNLYLKKLTGNLNSRIKILLI